jgi:APA family basic amino acid/polyamine antiporter
VAIWAAATVSVIYVLQNDFAALANKFILGSWPFYALAVLGVYRLRATRPDATRPYRTLGYPVTPAIFLLASVLMVGNAFYTEPADTGFTFGVIAVGIPVYFVWRAYRR